MILTWFVGAWLVVGLIWACGGSCRAPEPTEPTVRAPSSTASPAESYAPHALPYVPLPSLDVHDVDVEELEQVHDWIGFSLACYKKGLAPRESLLGSVHAMCERLSAIDAHDHRDKRAA